EAFVLLGVILSGSLLGKMLTGDMAFQASQATFLAFIAAVSGLMTAICMLGTGSLSLSRPDPSLFAAVSDLLSRFTSGLAKGGWKVALLLTLLMAGLFAGILRLHTLFHPPSSEMSGPAVRRAWRQKNAFALRSQQLQFVPTESAAAESGGLETATGPSDAQRAIQSRFLLLRGTKHWTGRKIQRINVFTKPRDFLDRWVRSLASLRPTLWTICLELNARATRFQLLDPSERREERERLEACLTVFGNMLSREVQGGKTISPARKQFLADTLTSLSGAVSTDAAFRQALQALPVVPATGEEVDPAVGLIEYPTATPPVEIPALVAPAFRPGGALRLGNESGVSVSFPIRPEMTPLVRGTSFRDTFEITRLETLRERPLLLELVFIP
ncbi:MAG TPA: hypothetical protein PLY73_16230, partial [Candidatus Ozemobacteraceae bacterium]|nr:hypothetical protein [Candidatus Ozemobacteraceae bacterium]